MKWTRKTIENTIIISLAVLTAGSLVYVPLASYLPFKENQDQILSAAIERDNKTLRGIEANLKEGVKVYDNGLATLDENDFDVYAVYGGKYADALKILLEPDQYSISVPNDFSVNGGLVSISYMGKVIEMNIPLQKMELVDLKVIENPYKVTYEKGENFDVTGLVIRANYSDGSFNDLTGDKIQVTNGSSLTTGTKSVTVKFTDNAVTKEIQIPINVLDKVDNGTISSLTYVGEYRVVAGSTFSSPVTVLAKYDKTQNRAVLPASQYTIEGGDVKADLGKLYEVKAVLNSDSSKSCTIPVIVSHKIEGEIGVMRNVKKTTEPEYTYENGVFKKGSDITFAAVTGKVTASGDTCSLSFTFNSYTDCVSRVIIKSSNPFYQNGAMSPLVLNHVMDVIINGNENEIDDSVKLKGTPNGETVEVYNIYHEYDLGHVQLKAGVNSIEFKFHASEYGELTSWNEPPCSVNIDYFKLETYNHVHDAKKVDAKSSTCTKEGYIAHYYCEKCGQHYEDSNCTKHIPNVATEPKGHDFGEWTHDDEKHTSVCKNGCGESKSDTHYITVVYKDGALYQECETCNYSKKIEGEVRSIYIPDTFTPNYATKLSATPVIAVVGTEEFELDPSLVRIINANDPKNEHYLFGDNSVTVQLKDNPDVSFTKVFTIPTEYSSVLNYVDLIEENGKVYWTFEFENRGYTADQYRIFDGTNTFVPEQVEETIKTIKFKIDVTSYGNATYYPHASYTVDGVTTLYTAHKNGDLLVSDGRWNKDKTINLNGKTYKLTLNYNMATLVVS